MSFLAHIFPLASKWLEVSVSGHSDETENEQIRTCQEQLLNSSTVENPRHIIIAGPDTANKTSLVFQAAVTAATSGSKVVHVCTHPISRLPTPIHGMPYPEPSVMKNVDFLYFEDCSDLITFFAGVHMKKKLPAFIIVEDILSYASQRQDKPVERMLAKLLAIITNASNWMAAQGETGKCNVLLTAPSRIKSMQNVLRQFDYKLAVYEGPTKDDSFSKLSFECNKAHISITFDRSKDCLILKKVNLATITSSNSHNGNDDNG